MQKKLGFLLSFCLLIFLSSGLSLAQDASPTPEGPLAPMQESGPTSTPFATVTEVPLNLPPMPHAVWQGYFKVSDQVPFVWLRSDPGIEASIVVTLPPGFLVQAVSGRAGEGTYWDEQTKQWWGYVILEAFTGWVEMASFVRADAATPTWFPSPTQGYPALPHSSWNGSFKVKDQVPFVWLRPEPDVNAPILTTLPRGTVVNALTGRAGDVIYLDEKLNQWWGFVVAGAQSGWVEMASFVKTDAPAVTPAVNSGMNWSRNNVVKLRRGVPFAWLRDYPSSIGGIKGTILNNYAVIIYGEAMSDGQQWWWPVRDPNSAVIGYVEQNSLQFSAAAPNFYVMPIAPDQWQGGYILKTKSGVPFVWIREEAGGSTLVDTVLAGGEVIVTDSLAIDDGYQVWQEVYILNKPQSLGWVEAKAFDVSGIFSP